MSDNHPLRLVLSVVVTCVVASGALGATYLATRERILDQDRQAEARSLSAAYQGAESFDPVLDEALLTRAQEAAGEPRVLGIFRAVTAEEEAGWALKVAPRGYGGRIQMVVAVDRNGKVLGVSILTMNETPGLGTQVGQARFLEQFSAWSAETIADDAKTLDAISGATKSSRGVANGVAAAGRVFDEVLRGEEVASR
ncbi:MAG: FMN-binding protein [Coriobacteriia bacterium]|nr:FMN-binding protein [Coriobacteriia bacterium]